MAAELQEEVKEGPDTINIAGDDIIYTETYNKYGQQIEIELQQDNDFFEPNLEPFKPPKFIGPKSSRQLTEIIRQNRLLVLGGSAGIDKSAFARNLAWYLSETQQSFDSGETKVSILEWNRSSSDLPNVEIKIQDTITSTIFILPKITPQDVKYDLSSIKRAADKNKHFVIISTDIPYSSWKLPKDDQHFWQELDDNLYSINDLSNILIRGLIDAQDSLPDSFLSVLEPDQPLVKGLLIQEAAEKLKTPDNISRFVTLLCAEKKPLQLSVINDLIKDANDKQRTLERWYPALSPREQLLALGLSFFDGLFDDQFFAAIERVVDKVWQRRDSSLRALDYCDLDKLRNFFDFVPAEDYGIKIESRIPEQRRMLFEIAWNSHRRQILAALPVIAQLGTDSVAGRSHDPELYGTLARRDQLRMVISEALSDIGLISVGAVQRTLLRLATDEDLGVQAIAARSMARWRQYGHDADLFKILHEWQIKDGRRDGPRDRIRATVALTVSYAARYDSANDLDDRLCYLLNELAKDLSPLVRNRFSTHTLPNVVPRHIKKLRKNLHDMVEDEDYILGIAKSLAFAYRYNAKDVDETLNIWYQECGTLRSLNSNSAEITLREKLLSTIALTYGHIKFDEVTGISADEAFKRMQNILAEETHPFVHKNVVIAISRQASNNFEKIEPSLQKLISEVTESDSEEVIQILKDIYLEQRRELRFGEDFIVVDGKQYPIWIDSERPLTAVEYAMHRWIKSSNNPVAQQIAARASVAFVNALDQKEEQRISEIKEQRKQYIAEPQVKLSQPVVLPVIHQQAPMIRKCTLIEKLAIRFATLKEERYFDIIQGLLPEVLALKKTDMQAMTFVLGKWSKAADNEIKIIVRLQDRAIWLIERRGLMIGVPVLGILALLIFGAMQNVLLIIVVLVCICILVWFILHSNQGKNQGGIKNLPLKQNALQLKDSLNRFMDNLHRQ